MDADMAPDVWFDLPAGHDFHVVNDAVLNEMRVNERGQIEIPGRALYEVLVLPDESRMKESTLRSIASLLEAGATVIGPRPQMSPGLQGGPEADRRVQELAAKLWGPIDGRLVTAHAYGKGRMLQGESVVNALRSRKVVRDFEVIDRGSKLAGPRPGRDTGTSGAPLRPAPGHPPERQGIGACQYPDAWARMPLGAPALPRAHLCAALFARPPCPPFRTASPAPGAQ